MDWFQRRKKGLSAFLIILVCIGLFLPWGEAGFGGEIKIGESYSNPIWIRGSYLRGAAAALKELSNELEAFQRECGLAEQVILAVLLFLAVLECSYVVCILAGVRAGYYIGMVSEILVLAVLVLAIVLALLYQNGGFGLGKYVRVVTDIHLNAMPFLLIFLEITGKQVCSVKKFD